MSSSCCTPGQRHRLVVLGGGSAAFAAAIAASEQGADVTLVNSGLPIGGTCVNVGCVPSKTLIRAAEAHHRASHHAFAGVESHSTVRDFAAIIGQKRQLVEELRQAKYVDVIARLANVRIVHGRGRFVAPLAVEVEGNRMQGDSFLIATGARPAIPALPGLADAGFLTNESAFELEDLPSDLIVVGGRYIALETAQMFARLGTRVTVLQRSARILPDEAEDLTAALTGFLAAEGISIVTGCTLREVRRTNGEIIVTADVAGTAREFRAQHVLLATGRTPNTSDIGLESVDITSDRSGFIRVDDSLRTTNPRVFAAGDVIGEPMFVYAAAYEGSLAARNAISGENRRRDYRALPWVIFTDPQVAGVGLDLAQATAAGIDAQASTLPLAHVPRCLAARDTRGFVQLVRDRATDQLVGARILAPEGSELLMEIALAIKHGIPAAELAASFHPYLTLSEAVKLTAIGFARDPTTLSCCAT